MRAATSSSCRRPALPQGNLPEYTWDYGGDYGDSALIGMDPDPQGLRAPLQIRAQEISALSP